MPYVNCSNCSDSLHVSPIDIKAFNKRFIEGNEPIYCFKCYKKHKEKDYDKLLVLKDGISDPILRSLVEQGIVESRNLLADTMSTDSSV